MRAEITKQCDGRENKSKYNRVLSVYSVIMKDGIKVYYYSFTKVYYTKGHPLLLLQGFAGHK